MQKYFEYLKCDLTDAEIADAAKELARANGRRTSIEQQKKEVDSQLKGEIETQNTIIQRLANLINAGHEYRNIDCIVELDTPEPGRKRIVRTDTGEEVKVTLMTDADRQMALDLQEKAEKSEAAAEAEKERGPIITPPPVLPRIGAPVEMQITGPNGEVLFSGTDSDFSKAAADVAAGDRPSLLKKGKKTNGESHPA